MIRAMRTMRWMLAMLLGTAFATGADAGEFISPAIPGGFGVNIHFTDAQPGELEMLAAAGFKFIRMDFDWAVIEREPGVYDFTAYERLLDQLEAHGLRALLILDYANPLYDENQSPHTDPGRAAFARWAAAGARHFRGRGILWEMYNEPNIAPFWRPRPDTEDYIKLAIETGRAIREAAPGEVYVGPATSGVDLPFLEACFKAGLLEYWDAVSVHPYRQVDPETAAEDYRALRRLIRRYAPRDKAIPILSGEWGYSTAWAGFDEERQAKMLARQWLTNLASDVPLSIWYDWHDDGPDEKEPEHHFGTVRHTHHQGREPPYDPKPAYHAAKALASELRGYRFNKRLALSSPDEYMLLFENAGEVKIAAWTTARTPREVLLPASPGEFAVASHLGESNEPVRAGRDGVSIRLHDAPVYLTPARPNDLLRLALAWERLPPELLAEANPQLSLTLSCPNPLDRDIAITSAGGASSSTGTVSPGGRIELSNELLTSRFDGPASHSVIWEIGGLGTLRQDTTVVVTDAVQITLLPLLGEYLPVQVHNPSGKPFEAAMTVSVDGRAIGPIDALRLEEQERAKTVLRHAPAIAPGAAYRAGVRVELEGGERSAIVSHRFQPLLLNLPALQIRAEGDAEVGSEQSIDSAEAPEGLPATGVEALRITYRFDAGWKYVCLAPSPGPHPIEGKPSHLGMWIRGDGSGNITRMRFIDATGQTFQPDGEKLTFTDWRYLTFPLDGSRAGHWGGAGDGVVHYPIRLETILLIDSFARRETAGTVHVSGVALVYQD
jgi:polysaccharide biosynthesis protein PslG